MKPVNFEYQRPRTLPDAIGLLAEADAQAKVIAGGQSLGPMLNMRLVQPEVIIDITAIDELKQVERQQHHLVLGACVTHADVEDGRVPDVTGGAMRQVGILAAAAAYALEHNRARLADDHANCRALANGLAKLPGLEIDAEGVETNMLFIGTGERDAAALAKRLDDSGIRLLATGPHTLRAVTNLTVMTEEIAQVITAFEESL